MRLLLAGAFATLAGPVAALCADDTVELRGDFGAARFTVEVADDAQERSLGLMNRETMPTGAGMLFVYPAPQRAGFWMKNTLIPLDMIFADETGTVTKVHENAIPLDETLIDGGAGVKFVLEINGGLAGAMGIAEGTEMRHPAIEETGVAAWPCE
ncbi:MAG: DUF192 domain-containing protein [Pseudomonadota bacterium]